MVVFSGFRVQQAGGRLPEARAVLHHRHVLLRALFCHRDRARPPRHRGAERGSQPLETNRYGAPLPRTTQAAWLPAAEG